MTWPLCIVQTSPSWSCKLNVTSPGLYKLRCNWIQLDFLALTITKKQFRTVMDVSPSLQMKQIFSCLEAFYFPRLFFFRCISVVAGMERGVSWACLILPPTCLLTQTSPCIQLKPPLIYPMDNPMWVTLYQYLKSKQYVLFEISSLKSLKVPFTMT